MAQEEKLRKELERLINNCQTKRVQLQDVNITNGKTKRKYTLGAGVMSISSAVLLSAVVADLVPAQIIQFLSVLLAAGGGMIAIYSSLLQNDGEVANIYSGSSKFLAVREKANYIALHEYLDTDEAMDNYNELVYEYTNLSEIYDKYIPFAHSLTQTEMRRYSQPTTTDLSTNA